MFKYEIPRDCCFPFIKWNFKNVNNYVFNMFEQVCNFPINYTAYRTLLPKINVTEINLVHGEINHLMEEESINLFTS